MMTYRHGERPDFKGLWWHLFWIVWCAFGTGFFIARADWWSVAIQLVCLAAWIYWTIDRLRNMTWHVIEINIPTGKENS